MIVLLFEIGIMVAALILNDKLMESLSSNLAYKIESFNGTKYTLDSDYDPMQIHGVDFLQINLECCGGDSYQDWIRNEALEATSSVPDSCCKVLSANCGLGLTSSLRQNITASETNLDDVINVSGCIAKIRDLFKRNYLIFGLILVGIFGVQIITIILSWCLSQQMNEGRMWKHNYKRKEFNKRNYF